MKVFIDSQVYSLQKVGGASRIYTELYKRFNNNNYGIDVITPPYWGCNAYARSVGLSERSFFPRIDFRNKARFAGALTRMSSLRAMRVNDYDIFHPTYYDPYFLKRINGKPFVLTILDMIHERYADTYFTGNTRISDKKKLLAKAATRIIAISQTTKNDLVRIFGIDEDKIDVVYLGNSLNKDINNDKIEMESERSPYVLYVGQRDKYKNFITFVRAVSPVLHELADLDVMCIGGGPFTEAEYYLLDKHQVRERFHQRYVSDAKLATYYANAAVLVVPSEYEGFGMPIIEAFASDCPVIVSEIPVFREIAGEAALYFQVHDTQKLAQLLLSVLTNEEQRKKLVRLGGERSLGFSWDRCADETAKVYRIALDKA